MKKDLTELDSSIQEARNMLKDKEQWRLLGPFHGAIAVPCHALSLLLSWTSHTACAIAVAGVRLATPGDWQCNSGSQ